MNPTVSRFFWSLLIGLVATAACMSGAASARPLRSADAQASPASATVTPPCPVCDRQATLAAGRAATQTLLAEAPSLAGTPPAMALPRGFPEGQSPARPIVRAVLFWMDGCAHCHQVIDTVLPPLQAQYGAQLEIQLIEVVTLADLDRLYQVAAAFGLSKEQTGVPLLIIGGRALVGSDQIPAELPGLIEQHLAAGGVDYPDLEGLAGVRFAPATAPAFCAPATPCAETETAPPAVALPSDPATTAALRSNGFELAIAILAGMLAALAYAGARLLRAFRPVPVRPRPAWLDALIPLLALAGLGVAGYLAYVETQALPAICGPVGDCNAVQSSPYARLFGVLPIGVLGVLGYAAILALWAWGKLQSGVVAKAAPPTVFGLALIGVAFSIYLTYLELFVIGAVCAWCLTSAVIMTALMLLSLGPALSAIASSRRQSGSAQRPGVRRVDGEV